MMGGRTGSAPGMRMLSRNRHSACDPAGQRSGRALRDTPRGTDPLRRLGTMARSAGREGEPGGRDKRAWPEWRDQRCRSSRSSNATGHEASRESAAARSRQAPCTTPPTLWTPRRRDRSRPTCCHVASGHWMAARPATRDRRHEESAATTSQRPKRAEHLPPLLRALREGGLFERRDQFGHAHVVAAGDHVDRLVLLKRRHGLS